MQSVKLQGAIGGKWLPIILLFANQLGRCQDPQAIESHLVRGDVDGTGWLSSEDALTVLTHLFFFNPERLECDDAADVNDDGSVNISDAVSLLFHLYGGAPAPPPPFPACGEDPTVDSLDCGDYWICGTGSMVNSINMNLRPVQPGTFLMGSPLSERGRSTEEIPHVVTITCSFYMSETEVTQGQYLEVMGENPSWINGAQSGINFGVNLRRPVENMSWFDAEEFCRRLSVREGRFYRLPYEAEWEYACRSGTTTRFWPGDSLECDDDCPCVCPSLAPYMFSMGDGNRGGIGLPVGQKLPNHWGFHDMHGLMVEWCRDWYGPYLTDAVVNPTGPETGTKKVLRGFRDDVGGLRLCRSATRGGTGPSYASSQRGFRVVLELPRCSYGD